MTLRTYDVALPGDLQELVFLHDRLHRRISMIREAGYPKLADELIKWCFDEIADMEDLIEVLNP